MSPPKKGKDLSALKARLAKKAAKTGPEDAVGAPGEAASGEPPPSEIETQAAPAEPLPAEFGPPGEPAPAPAPAAPAPSPEPALRFESSTDDAGVEIKPRKSRGLTVLVFVAACGFGALAGWLARQGVDTTANVASAKAKGGAAYTEVDRLQKERARVSLGMEDVKTAMAKDPATAATRIQELTTGLGAGAVEAPNSLFGWQMASMHPRAINQVFDFYLRYLTLADALGQLSNHINVNAQQLAAAAGPGRFVVVYTERGAILQELIRPMCAAEEGAPPAPCAEGSEADAVGYEIREAPGAEPQVVGKEAATPLLNEGPMFKFAFGDKPDRTAIIQYTRLLRGVDAQVEEIVKAEKRAIESLEGYSENAGMGSDDPAE